SPDGKTVLTAGENEDKSSGSAYLWDVDTGKQVRQLGPYSHPVHAAGFSPDGRKVLVLTMSNTAVLWDLTTGKGVGLGHDSWVAAFAFSPRRPLFVTADK